MQLSKKYYTAFESSYALKTTPKAMQKDHPDIELLEVDQFYCIPSFQGGSR